MQVVITSGHPYSGYRLMHKVLELGGLQAADPSRREGLTTEALTESILRAHNTDVNALGDLRQLSPGKLWQELAVDLFLGNLSKENWGWADASATWLLDFWLRFDGQIRFILVYCSPISTIINMIRQGAVTIDSLSIAVQSWIRWNTELLQFSARHLDRCLMVNTDAALRSPGALIVNANDAFNMRLTPPPDDVFSAVGGPSALASFLANDLLAEFPEALALYGELESAAHLQDSHEGAQPVARRHVWEEYLGSLANLEKLHADLGHQSKRCHRAGLELATAASAHEESRKELAEARARLEGTRQAIALADEREGQLLLRNTALMNENELLFMQLKQLQIALEEAVSTHRDSERQHLELAKKASNGATPARANCHLAEVALDMRREIDGKNWYWAEHDGRWAGPGTDGTLRLPAMGPGPYEVNLEVVDAMDPEILAGMQVTLCGVPLSLAREGKSYPAILKGVVIVEDAGAEGNWDVSFRFPSLSSPAQRGSTDTRQLAIRLRSLRIRALQIASKAPN